MTADISGLLGQVVLPPWAAQPRLDNGTADQGPADDRPAESIADQIARTIPGQDPGDGSAPPDPGETLRRFVQAVTAAGARERDGGWLGGIREYVPDSGPVTSSRFPVRAENLIHVTRPCGIR